MDSKESTSVKDLLLKRLRTMAGQDSLFTDPYAKALRAYGTEVHPLFIERLSVHYPEKIGTGRLVQGKTFAYHQNYEYWSGSRLMNYIFQSFYDQEVVPESEARVLYSSVSTKTYSTSDDQEEPHSVREATEQWVAAHAAAGGGTACFSALAVDNLGAPVVDDLTGDFGASKFAREVVSFLADNRWSVPAAEVPVITNRKLRPYDLVMRARYYATRDDYRAYCRDHHNLRSLAGAMLHNLFYPRQEGIRKNLHRSALLPAVRRDSLNISVPRCTQKEITLLLLGDVSNFTGSFVNAWVMLFCMALDASKALQSKYNVFGVGGHLILASWSEVLIVYLYLTVGVSCYVEDLDEHHTLPGGYLGVNANITVSLVAFCVVLQDTLHRLLERCSFARCQIGGDDFAIVIKVKPRDEDWAQRLVQERITAFVGKLKDLKVVRLDDRHEGVLSDTEVFCKKRILLLRNTAGVHLSTEDSVPLPEILSPSYAPLPFRDQVVAWYKFDRTLKSYDDQHPEHCGLTDALRAYFLRKYPGIAPLRRRTVRTTDGRLRVYNAHGTWATRGAHQAICSIEDLVIGDIELFRSYDAKLKQATMIELVTQRWIEMTDCRCLATLLPGEMNLFEDSQSDVETLMLEPDMDLIVALTKILE